MESRNIGSSRRLRKRGRTLTATPIGDCATGKVCLPTRQRATLAAYHMEEKTTWELAMAVAQQADTVMLPLTIMASRLRLPAGQGMMPDRNLNAEVARRIWGEECVTINDEGVVWVQSAELRFFGVIAFDTALDDCHRHMLPALEKRGLGEEFVEELMRRLPYDGDFHGDAAYWYRQCWRVFGLPPSAWCEAFAEVWGDE